MSSETVPPLPADAADPDEDVDADTIEHIWARTSARIAVIAAGATMMGPCTGFASYLIALPLGLFALSLAYRAYAGAPKHSATRAYAKLTLFVGGLSVAFSGAFMVFVGMYTLLIFATILLASR